MCRIIAAIGRSGQHRQRIVRVLQTKGELAMQLGYTILYVMLSHATVGANP